MLHILFSIVLPGWPRHTQDVASVTRGRPIHLECVCVFRWGGGPACVRLGVGERAGTSLYMLPPLYKQGPGEPGASQEVGLPHHEAGRAPAAPAAVQGPVHEVEVALGLAPQQVALDAVRQRLVGQLEAAPVHQHEEPVVLGLQHLELLGALRAQRLGQRVGPRRQRPRLLLGLQVRHADEVLRGEAEGAGVIRGAQRASRLTSTPTLGAGRARRSLVALDKSIAPGSSLCTQGTARAAVGLEVAAAAADPAV